ncbi:DUF4221 domain-containing protein [Algoriphagus sp. AGSA1]|uniref:DUF4221 family protein n=1 Tax=Algoriphagus sp. AGSA1 TaxID=2907213 RepID=UPI001F37C8B5|nr:DUF4221 family protein [Algoriphagus sp. AGSA1]MCE7055730.1 DUF4221 domain-containing protein [Algoriphagus sp. AGSA1]
MKAQPLLKTFLVFVIVIFGCNQKTDLILSKQPYIKTTSLVPSDSFSISTKNAFDLYSTSLSYLTNAESEYISILNPNTQTISLYKNEDSQVSREIKIEIEGPNGIGELGFDSSHFLFSQDSIYIYNLQIGSLFLINEKGEVLNRYTITDYSDSINFPAPYPSNVRPIQSDFKQLFFPCGINNYPNDYENYPSVLSIDLESGQIKYPITYSNVYDQAFYGLSFKYDTGIAFNKNDNSITISYPVDNFIYKYYTENGNIEMKYGGSEHFDQIEFYDADPDKFERIDFINENEKLKNHALSNSDFAGILYDQFRNYYYRIAYIRPTIDEVKSGKTIPELSIIILDENLNKVGEDLFSSKIYDNSLLFISSSGLNIARKDLFEADENFIFFDTFIPKGIKDSK